MSTSLDLDLKSVLCMLLWHGTRLEEMKHGVTCTYAPSLLHHMGASTHGTLIMCAESLGAVTTAEPARSNAPLAAIVNV